MTIQVEDATAMVSFGTLVALWLVSNCQLYRRYSPGVQMRFTQCVGGGARGGQCWLQPELLQCGMPAK